MQKSKRSRKNGKTRKIQRGGTKPKSIKNETCDILDTTYNTMYNKFHKTCIKFLTGDEHVIHYITPTNMFIRNIESIVIPKFIIKLGNGAIISRKIMIEDKYVNCFLHVNNEWYAIMRLFGKTLNTGALARTEKNRAYFKLKCVSVNRETGMIQFADNSYNEIIDNQFLSLENLTIKINDLCVENITKKNESFKVIQRFRQEKIIGYGMRLELYEQAGELAVME